MILTFVIGDVLRKKSNKPFKSGQCTEIVKGFTCNEQDPKKRDAVIFSDGSICNISMLMDKL
jgi:hypothetical protein